VNKALFKKAVDKQGVIEKRPTGFEQAVDRVG